MAVSLCVDFAVGDQRQSKLQVACAHSKRFFFYICLPNDNHLANSRVSAYLSCPNITWSHGRLWLYGDILYFLGYEKSSMGAAILVHYNGLD